ncbi:hypothetical protein MZM54_29490 [[Brevibacterium] frigoritolerans]|nr:hypothetical protein [Peribacillus frigoritolerans]
MYPTKEQLIQHLSNKMTNQDIAKIYRTTYQKVQQLIKNYDLKPKELRKDDHYIVYEHWLDGEVIYVGSGLWYRCRRYTNRRNSEHKQLMKEGKIIYNIIAEYENEGVARDYEVNLIKYYKQLGQAKFNKKVNYT